MVLYLDSNATTPLCENAKKEMLPWFDHDFGNPHALQTINGRHSAKAVEKARSQILNFVSASDYDLIFTSGASEANNLALRGVLGKLPEHKNHIIISNIEHASVLRTAESLENEGYLVSKVSVNSEGLINTDELESIISKNTALVSIIHGNNEIGTMQDLSIIAKIVKRVDALFHSDISQSALTLETQVNEFGIDLISLSSHKMYGPQGIGALVFNSDRVDLSPMITGGSQQGGLRSGTIPVMLAVGFGAAVEYLQNNKKNILKTLIEQREYLIESLLSGIPNSKILGHRSSRLPHNISIAIPYPNCSELIHNLNKHIACSLGASCVGESKYSHVLNAIKMKASDGFCAIRLGLGIGLSKPDLDYVITTIINLSNKIIITR